MRWLVALLPCVLLAMPRVEDLSLEQKVGQLFLAPLCPDRGADHLADWVKLMAECHVGGALLKQADVESQIHWLNNVQAISAVPLLITADAEWGLAMRLRGTMAFPRNMTLGAVQDTTLIEQMGEELGRQARAVGIHMNFAPVVDVNNNAMNPIIGMRSFGERPSAVAEHAGALVRGMQSSGLLTTLKHFPGHGDTGVDSHRALPVIPHALERLQSVELAPFRALLANTDAVMTAHIMVPALDPTWTATLSSTILTTLLRTQLQFEGLIVTDAMNMSAITQQYGAAAAALQAHKAGADLLLYGDHISDEVDRLVREAIPASYHAILSAYRSGELPPERLDASVRRILAAKERAGLSEPREIGGAPMLHTESAERLRTQLYTEALTWVGSPTRIDVARAELIDVVDGADPRESSAPQVVFMLRCINPRAENFGVSDAWVSAMRACAQKSDVTVCLFGTPYALKRIPEGVRVLVGYENEPVVRELVKRVLGGELVARGNLPVTVERGPR